MGSPAPAKPAPPKAAPRVFCKGKLVPVTHVRDGWALCTGCREWVKIVA